MATFTVVLNREPTADVTIAMSSSDTTEGAVFPASITFTPANWNVLQTVTVIGADDNIVDGIVAYKIITAVAVSTDPFYSGLNPADVSVTNIDNDIASITITPTSGLVTTEAGGTATFTVVLNTQPSANVTIWLSSSKPTEGTVSVAPDAGWPVSITFTPANWGTPRTVTITGVDDTSIDGNVVYTIMMTASVSSDVGGMGYKVADITVTNNDNDVSGITVTPISGLITTEAGGMATFTVVLDRQPTAGATVVIYLSSSDTTEGTVSPASLTFTTANWAVAQPVTVTGVDDSLDDGDVAYTIILAAAVSTDTNYSGLNPADVSVTNIDDENPGVVVTPTSGLTTTEAGGTATFMVVLATKPMANVTVEVSSSDTSEGKVSSTGNKLVLSFTPDNWNNAQVVTVTGVNDWLDDGDIAYTITIAAAVSSDPDYDGIDPADVSVINTDNDTPGITVAPTSGLKTNENGQTATFMVILDCQPTADVTIALSSNDVTEGTVSPASLTFTATNFNTPQTVTITGVDDTIVDNTVPFKIITAPAQSSDSGYNNYNPDDVSVANIDNEPPAGITVTPTSGLTTTEAAGAGHTATFTVVLTSAPTTDVTIALSSSDTTEGTVSPTSLTFTAANWNTPQTATVTGVDDTLVDHDVTYTIVTTAVSTDTGYNNINTADVTVINFDDDSIPAGITVSPTSGLITTEAGGTATFTVKLNSQPTADVPVNLSSSNTTEGTVSPASITFTTTNWNISQTVTVTGVADNKVDSNVAYIVCVMVMGTTDPNYTGIPVQVVSVTNNNIDNNTPGITVTPTSGLTTNEATGAGHTASFTVVLTSAPTADVTIPLSSSKPTEGTVSPASLVFTSANWSTPQTVTVTGVDDHIDDGDIAYTIITAAAVSTDPVYSGLNPADVPVTTLDDDNPECSYSFNAGWNLMTLSHMPDTAYMAATLANAINNQGGSITKLQKWDGSGWKTYSVGAPFGNFNIEIGKGYFLLANEASQWDDTYNSIGCITYAFASGWNLFGFPIGGPYTAKSLIQLINEQGGSITKVQRWDGSGWKTYSAGAPFGDFAISSKEGLFLLATSPSALDMCPFKLSNVRDKQFTVSWTSDSNESASVNYGTTTALGQTAYDDRGQVSSKTHHVSIKGLSPNTKYYYEIVSGSSTFNNSGNYFTITTGPSIIPAGSVSPAGQVFQSDGVTFAEGAIVYITLKDIDTQGSTGSSAVESVLVDTGGFWSVELVNMRNAGYQSLFSFTENSDYIVVEVNAGAGKKARIETEATDWHNGDSPRPSITLP